MAEGSSFDVSRILNAINRLENNIDIVNSNVCNLDKRVGSLRADTMTEFKHVKGEISYVQTQIVLMEKAAAKRAALQRAITEIIRVNQELEQKFGTQQTVRDYMRGILQAVDSGLVSRKTISQCSEELMLSAPDYWLAPALVALAAWIGDNKQLADKAIVEAIKRDESKTCLLFALITRRVDVSRRASGAESNTCFLWLERYFACQEADKMTSSIVCFVDAYSNGVFGKDKDNRCAETIAKWMKTLMKNDPEFAEKQKTFWVKFFDDRRVSPNSDEFKALAAVAPQNQYKAIDTYVSKINASERPGGIKSGIANILEGEADVEKLKENIDDYLEKLISDYEKDEVALRDEKTKLELIKETEGDEEEADKKMAEIEAKRYDPPVNFAKRLSDSILDPNAEVSSKKTAVTLLRSFISDAFNEFITEDKEAYPTTIDLTIKENGGNYHGKSFEWKGTTENAENRTELVESLSEQYDTNKKASIQSVTDEALLAQKKKGTLIALLLFWTIIGLFVGLSIRKKAIEGLAANEELRKNLDHYYDTEKGKKVDLLNAALNAREKANQTVSDFQSDSSAEVINFQKLDEANTLLAAKKEEATANSLADALHQFLANVPEYTFTADDLKAFGVAA